MITDKILDNYKKLSRNKNTWSFLFRISGVKTKFLIKKFNNDYIIYITQSDKEDIFEYSICLGKLTSTEDLENIFLSITRGEHLS